jgi:hypothetical protein
MIEKNLIGRLEMGIEKWELLVHASVSESVRVKEREMGAKNRGESAERQRETFWLNMVQIVQYIKCIV